MTNTRSTHQSSSAYGRAHDADDLADKGTAAFRDAKAGVESVIADAGKMGREVMGREVMDNVRDVGDTLADAVEKSIRSRPYTTLALTLAAGFVFGAIWRR